MAKSPVSVSASANDLFDQFMSASTLKGVVTTFRRICQLLGETLVLLFVSRSSVPFLTLSPSHSGVARASSACVRERLPFLRCYYC